MQTTGKNRNQIDKFYTNPNIVKKYINHFEKYVNDNDLVIEPSAGNGAWSIPLRKYNLIAFDIQPEAENIQQMDFLEVDLWAFNSNLHFIGNPPFGRQSSMAKKFIKKITSCKRTKTIAFILPKSFKKDSFQKAFPLNYHLDFQEDIEKNAFLMNGHEYDVPCVFQIWVRKEMKRKEVEKVEPKGFKFVKKDEEPDYSVRRVGVYAGKISPEIESKSPQSHYFIKLDKIDLEFMNRYEKNIKWEHNNTVGPRSISKPELINVLNNIIM